MAVLIRRGLASGYKQEVIERERAIGVTIQIGNNEINIVNVYVPNDSGEQLAFIVHLYDRLAGKKNLILIGDFNHVVDNRLDRLPQSNEKLKREQEEWKIFYKNMKLQELTDFPAGQFTWSNRNASSRIDRIYINDRLKGATNEAKYDRILDHTLSDHRLVTGSIQLTSSSRWSETSRSCKTWKMNNETLGLPGVDERILEILDSYSNGQASGPGWYDEMISKIRRFLIGAQRTANDLRRFEINSLTEEYNDLCRTGERTGRMAVIENEISNYYEKKNNALKIRNRVARRQFFKVPTRAVLELDNRQAAQARIDELEIDGRVSDSQEEIARHLDSFYRNLYTKREMSADVSQYKFKMRAVAKPETLERLSRDYTLGEVEEVIRGLQDSSPGLNGLTVAFFKRYWPSFGPLLLKLANSDDFEPPKQFKTSYVKLIPKKKKQNMSANDYRPITITNVDYRIFSKLLTNRLRTANDEIFGPYQFCAMDERKPHDLLYMITGLIHDSNVFNRPLLMASIDQYKAFDMIDHGYLKRALQHVNVGPRAQQIIEKLYDNAKTNLLVNGRFMPDIQVTSGLKQGCPLSMWLYMVCIEEALVRINENKEIKGYEVRILDKNEIKVRAYADDLTLFLVNEQSIRIAIDELKAWGDVSGAVINDKKTQILPIKRQARLVGYETVQEMKVLGIQFDTLGPAKSNTVAVMSKFKQELYLWSSAKMNVIDRIVALRTFILSKVWYVASFVPLSSKQQEELDRSMHLFIWNSSKREYVKRKTLIKDMEHGGLGMVCLKSKLSSIALKYFARATVKYKQPEYQFALRWFKSHLSKLGILSYNSFSPLRSKPLIIEHAEKSLIAYKEIMKARYKVQEIGKKNLKELYLVFREKEEVKPKCETEIFRSSWKETYNRIHAQDLSTKYRASNYRFLMNGLPTGDNMGAKENCYLCGTKKESVKHLLDDCPFSKRLSSSLSSVGLTPRDLSYEKILLNDYKCKNQIAAISKFKHVIWTARNKRRTAHTPIEQLATGCLAILHKLINDPFD